MSEEHMEQGAGADSAQEGEQEMNLGMSDEFVSFDQKAIVKVVGIGGGGGNAVGRMIEAGLQDVEFITINTDAQALRKSPAGTRLQIGSNGLGAGARPDVARAAAEEQRERLSEVLQGADMIFLTAGLGGGTGTGATPVVAEIAKDTGALTVGIVTLPFNFEGGERMDNALKGLESLQEHVDAAIVVPNDRLSILCQTNVSFLNAFRLADEVLHNGVRSISELITMSGLINLDFADVRTIMQNSGRALMGIGRAEGEERAKRAAEDAIVVPLLENATIEGATRVIVNVQGGSDIGMREVHDAVATVQRGAHPKANIIFGAVVDDEERPELKVTVIAAGFVEQPQKVVPFTEMNPDNENLPLGQLKGRIEELQSPRPAQEPEQVAEAPIAAFAGEPEVDSHGPNGSNGSSGSYARVEHPAAAAYEASERVEADAVSEAPPAAVTPDEAPADHPNDAEDAFDLSAELDDDDDSMLTDTPTFAPESEFSDDDSWQGAGQPPVQTTFETQDEEPEEKQEEDLGIPAFMRRRMRRR